MKSKEENLKKFIRHPRLSVSVNDTLLDVLEMHNKNNLKVVFVVDEEYSLVGVIDKEMLKEIKKFNIHTQTASKVCDYIDVYELPIVVYPNMTNVEALEIMDQFDIDYLPVLNSPWNKKLAGFVWYEEISWSKDILLG